MEWDNTDSEINLFSHISSASTNFSGSNGSDKVIADNNDHNITMDMPLEKKSISTSSSLSSRSQTPTFLESPDTAELG